MENKKEYKDEDNLNEKIAEISIAINSIKVANRKIKVRFFIDFENGECFEITKDM